jgi:hypothetical protein
MTQFLTLRLSTSFLLHKDRWCIKPGFGAVYWKRQPVFQQILDVFRARTMCLGPILRRADVVPDFYGLPWFFRDCNGPVTKHTMRQVVSLLQFIRTCQLLAASLLCWTWLLKEGRQVFDSSLEKVMCDWRITRSFAVRNHDQMLLGDQIKGGMVGALSHTSDRFEMHIKLWLEELAQT